MFPGTSHWNLGLSQGYTVCYTCIQIYISIFPVTLQKISQDIQPKEKGGRTCVSWLFLVPKDTCLNVYRFAYITEDSLRLSKTSIHEDRQIKNKTGYPLISYKLTKLLLSILKKVRKLHLSSRNPCLIIKNVPSRLVESQFQLVSLQGKQKLVIDLGSLKNRGENCSVWPNEANKRQRTFDLSDQEIWEINGSRNWDSIVDANNSIIYWLYGCDHFQIFISKSFYWCSERDRWFSRPTWADIREFNRKDMEGVALTTYWAQGWQAKGVCCLSVHGYFINSLNPDVVNQ